jgi:hypothetical protein
VKFIDFSSLLQRALKTDSNKIYLYFSKISTNFYEFLKTRQISEIFKQKMISEIEKIAEQ